MGDAAHMLWVPEPGVLEVLVSCVFDRMALHVTTTPKHNGCCNREKLWPLNGHGNTL